MVDLRGFRKANGLTQEVLGDYLDMKKSFISKIEHRREKLPEPKLRRLLENEMGWDTSMLTVADTAVHNANDVNIQSGPNSNIYSCEAELAALRRENELLRSQVEDLKSREAQYWEMIKNLTSK